MQRLHRVVAQHTHVLINSLDPLSLQIVQFALYHGPIPRAALLAEAHDGDPAGLDRRVRDLVTLGLATVRSGILSLSEELGTAVPLPLPSFRQDSAMLTSEELRQACRLLGVDGGTRKAERADAVRSVLVDRDRLVAAVTAAHPQAAEVFMRITDASLAASHADPGSGDGPGVVGLWDLGLPRELLGQTHRYGVQSGRDPGTSAFSALMRRCLVGGSAFGYDTWSWLECALAVRGHMFDSWSEPPPVPFGPIDEPVGVPVGTVVSAELLVDQIGTDAPEGKRTGDRRPPVKAVKRAAKAVGGIDGALAVIVIDAAIDLGLLVAVDLPPRGRGRNQERPLQWVVNRQRFETWRGMPVAHRWLSIVRHWMFGSADGQRLDLDIALRITALGALASLDAGTGVPAASFGSWMAQRHLLWNLPADNLIRDLALLGVTSSAACIGLSQAGRAMLAEHIAGADVPQALVKVLEGGDDAFVVQPDHTIVTGSTAPSEVLAVLSTVANRESDGAAIVWRLSADRLSRAARRITAEELVEFLTERSTVPVADNVVRFVRDHLVPERAAQIGAVSSYLTCDDTTILSVAVAVKAAKLTALSPQAAVSPLDPGRLREVLTAKGVPAELIGAAGAAGEAAGGDDPNPSFQIYQHAVDQPIRPPTPISMGPDVVAYLVQHLVPDGRGSGSPRPGTTQPMGASDE